MTAAATAAAHRDFDTEPLSGLPPSCTFTLGKKRWTCRNSDDVPFGTARLLFGADSAGEIMVQIEPFFRAILVPEQVDEFVKMLDDPTGGLTLHRVRDVIEFVAEQVLGFPTMRASGSSSKSKPRARKQGSSRARSSSPATRRRASGE